jgi:hypothetical protein
MLIKIDSLCIVFEKIYITKQFREIIYTKFHEMYWYLKNLHNEKQFREIICTKFRKISRKKVQQNFVEFREISQN